MRVGYIEGMNQDKIAYATQASEALFVVSALEESNDFLEMRMEILRENFEHFDDHLYIAFNRKDEKLLSKICSQPVSEREVSLRNVSIEFEVKHIFFNILIKAVNEIQPRIIERLFPTLENFQIIPSYVEGYEKLFLPPRTLSNAKLDDKQFHGLFKILTSDSKSPPILINGAFGTGKTRLIAVAAYCLIKQGIAQKRPTRILVCAHHQATADNLVEKYFGPMLDSSIFKLVRLTSSNYMIKSEKFSGFYKNSIYAMQSYTRQTPPYIIVATTFLTAPSLKRIFGKNFFSHILLDEGSQSREPEAISPLSLASPGTKIVIAGDPQQVS